MAPHIVILGAGTGGTLTANRLRKELPEAHVTVVDQDDVHVYQPGLLFVPFGLARPEDIVRPRGAQLHRGVEYHQSEIDLVDVEQRRVFLADGMMLNYDVLVVATGCRLVPEETEGLIGRGWTRNTFTFYDLNGATALARALEGFDGGRLVVNVVDMPIKCPVAPLEFCLLADWYFAERGIRDEPFDEVSGEIFILVWVVFVTDNRIWLTVCKRPVRTASIFTSRMSAVMFWKRYCRC